MAERRTPDARIARLESCFARIEERLNALVDQRKDWKSEVERRLDENNANAAKLMAERARDRAELVSLDLYNSRHQELKVKSESDFRELSQKIETLSIRLDQKISDHNRDDTQSHKEQDDKIEDLAAFKANMQGRMLAFAAIAAALATLAQLILHAVLK